MKKLLIMLFITGMYKPVVKAQCPAGASAVESVYPLCSAGCAVLLSNWPNGVVVNIFGGNPLHVITDAIIPGAFGSPGTGSAFVCVPCNIPLTFASVVPDSSNGCVITNESVLPIILNSFAAEIFDGSTVLKWTVSFEQGDVSYIVQRSNDGKNFSDLTTLQGMGNEETVKNYSYTDGSSNQGIVYYRLKISQANGIISYSSVVSVNNPLGTEIKIYPNPIITNSFNITLPDDFLPAAITILDAQGRYIYSGKATQSSLTINTPLSSGVYALRIIGNNNAAIVQKIIKK